MRDHSESRLSRWSRVKTKSKQENLSVNMEPQAPALETTSLISNEPGHEPALVDKLAPDEAESQEGVEVNLDELAETHDLPKIDSLVKDSDYTGFLQTGVPEALKKAAMRKLWLSDPVLANVDGLNDYDDDFNVIDKLISILDTNYQVGKGMVDPDEEIEEFEDKKDETEEEISENLKNNLEDIPGEGQKSLATEPVINPSEGTDTLSEELNTTEETGGLS